MQKTYVFTTSVNFSQFDFYTIPADAGVYDVTNMSMTIYRSGDLIKTFHVPVSSIKSMEELGWVIQEGKAPKVAAPSVAHEDPEEVIPFSDIEGLQQMADMEVAQVLTKKDIEDDVPTYREDIEEDGGETERISIEPEEAVKVGESEERISFVDDTPKETPKARKLPKAKKPE